MAVQGLGTTERPAPKIDAELVKLVHRVFHNDGDVTTAQSDVDDLVLALSKENPHRHIVHRLKEALWLWAPLNGFQTSTAILRERGYRHVYLYSRGHRRLVRRSTACGCFHCLSRFSPSEIRHWIDGHTALCPVCSIDAVLPDRVRGFPLAEALLREMNGRSLNDVEAAKAAGVALEYDDRERRWVIVKGQD